jgi:hypothetical protein
MESIFDSITKDDLSTEPYPHLALSDVISQDLADELIKSYPSLDLLAGKQRDLNNFRYNYSANRTLQEDSVPQVWRDFIGTHVSEAFFHQFLTVFSDQILSLYPFLGADLGDLKKLKVGIRGIDTWENSDVLLDAQISGNTPVQSLSSVRGCHVDDPRKIYGALLYLREDEDDSEGGEFEVSMPRGKDFKYYNKVYISDRYAEVCKKLPYQKNNFAMFLNSPLSWHGVAERKPTKHPRKFVNLIAQFKEPLFDIVKYRDNWDYFLQKIRVRRYGKYDF